jgi:hypothetical protein
MMMADSGYAAAYACREERRDIARIYRLDDH